MKNITKRGKGIAAIGLGVAVALGTTLAQAQGGLADRSYRVEVTNIMSAGQFTPILAVTHAPSVRLFTLGDAPSEGLAALAEGGNNQPLVDALSGLKEVATVESIAPGDNGLTFAGTTTEFEITVPANFRFISLAAMILPTNDAFAALDTVTLPNRSRTYYALGYDAGSEVNDELCVNIPGPTCGGDGAFTEINGEGFVHISPGINGQAFAASGETSSDQPSAVDDAEYDWRNPVAKVVITRIK